MIVELIQNQISIPLELLEELEVESGQQLHLSVSEGVLHVCPAEARPDPPAASLTPDQEIAHFIADSFTKLEEIVALMAAVCDVKERVKKTDPDKVSEVGRRLEEIVLRAREESADAD